MWRPYNNPGHAKLSHTSLAKGKHPLHNDRFAQTSSGLAYCELLTPVLGHNDRAGWSGFLMICGTTTGVSSVMTAVNEELCSVPAFQDRVRPIMGWRDYIIDFCLSIVGPTCTCQSAEVESPYKSSFNYAPLYHFVA
jgi:hypothetical protein